MTSLQWVGFGRCGAAALWALRLQVQASGRVGMEGKYSDLSLPTPDTTVLLLVKRAWRMRNTNKPPSERRIPHAMRRLPYTR